MTIETRKNINRFVWATLGFWHEVYNDPNEDADARLHMGTYLRLNHNDLAAIINAEVIMEQLYAKDECSPEELLEVVRQDVMEYYGERVD